MRGLGFHRHITKQVCRKMESFGCQTRVEYPIQLPNGQFNFADIYAKKSGIGLIIEIETSLRNLVSNVRKANETGLPIWVIVPNHEIQQAAIRKLRKTQAFRNNFPVVLLISGIEAQKRNIFPP